jgi:hypothetical protein
LANPHYKWIARSALWIRGRRGVPLGHRRGASLNQPARIATGSMHLVSKRLEGCSTEITAWWIALTPRWVQSRIPRRPEFSAHSAFAIRQPCFSLVFEIFTYFVDRVRFAAGSDFGGDSFELGDSFRREKVVEVGIDG